MARLNHCGHTATITLFYTKPRARKNCHAGVSLRIPQRQVTALIGPSGCGKSTILRCLNRLNDVVGKCRVEGSVRIHGEDIYHRKADVISLRRRVGMVFQKPNPFPKTVFANVAFPLKVAGMGNRRLVQEKVEHSLVRAGLWDEVKDRLHTPALALSGGQQQRLCIARAIVGDPEILLMDEPCSALDPISTHRIESLINELGQHLTVVIVTHNMHQAMRVAHMTGFFYMGRLVEFNPTDKIFTTPDHQQTLDYVTGRFG